MVLDLLRQAADRPGRDTRWESCDALVSFLQGFDRAARHLNPGSKDPTGLDHFRRWLARRYARLCGGMGNLAWWSYLNEAFPDPSERLQQLPGLFEESMHAREAACKATGCHVVYYGISLPIRGEDELLEMEDDENRTLGRVSRAGLQSCWIPATVGSRQDVLLIGTQIGVFFGNRSLVVNDATWLHMMERTREALLELGYAETPALIIQWDSSYPNKASGEQ
jgi:hypothetical protein